MTTRSDDQPDGMGGDEMGGWAMPDMPSDSALDEFLGDLRTMAAVPAPEPSAPLAALLAGAVLIDPHRGSSPRSLLHRTGVHRNTVRRSAVHRSARAVAAVAVLLTSIAAVRHELPAPAQRVVVDVVKHVNPFHIEEAPHRPAPPAQTKPSAHAAPNGVTTRLKAPAPKKTKTKTHHPTRPLAAAPPAAVRQVVSMPAAPSHGVAVKQVKISVHVRVVPTGRVTRRSVHFTTRPHLVNPHVREPHRYRRH